MTNLSALLARWDSEEGRPYKGSLIDYDSYNGDGTEPPADIGCMCAQGQALHVLGGWTPERLHNTAQSTADKETAALLNISVAHAILLRNVNDKIDGAPGIVLTAPGKVLGNEWSKLLDFWWHLDQMTDEQWDAAWDAVGAAAWDAAWDAARAAVGDAVGAAAWDAARAAVGDAVGAAAWDAARAAVGDAAAYAASEIQGAKLLRERGQLFYFLPMFGFADPEAIPARPADYGAAA